MVAAGLNVVPTALVALGLGALVLAIAPRAAGPAVYALVIWSLLADLLASMVPAASWVASASLFHYLALAPADDVDLATVAGTLVVAALATAIALVVFERRDLQRG
jgi:putative exporter of polyketide antibiotics